MVEEEEKVIAEDSNKQGKEGKEREVSPAAACQGTEFPENAD